MKKKILALLLLVGLSATASAETFDCTESRFFLPLNTSTPSDYSGCTGNTASLHNTPNTGVTGVIGDGYGFDSGDADAVAFDVSQNFEPNGSTGWSVHEAINPDSISGNPFLTRFTNQKDVSIQLNTNGNSKINVLVDSRDAGLGYVYVNSNTVIPTGSWTNVTVTSDPIDSSTANISIYINGEFDTSSTAGVPFNDVSEGENSIGARSPRDDKAFDGRMDHIKFYNTVLNSSQISSLSTTGNIGTTTDDGGTTELQDGTLSSEVLQPSSQFTVTENNLFDFEVNTTCSSGTCEKVDTFAYLQTSLGSLSDLSNVGSKFDSSSMDRAHDVQSRKRNDGQVWTCVPSKNTGIAIVNNTDVSSPVVMDYISKPDGQGCIPVEGRDGWWFTASNNGIELMDATGGSINIVSTAVSSGWDRLNGLEQNGSLVWAPDKDGQLRFANYSESTNSVSVIGSQDVTSGTAHGLAHWKSGGYAISVHTVSEPSADYCMLDYWDEGSNSYHSFPYNKNCYNINNFDESNRGEVDESTGILYETYNPNTGTGFASEWLQNNTKIDQTQYGGNVGMAKYPEDDPEYLFGSNPGSSEIDIVEIDKGKFTLVKEVSVSPPAHHDMDTFSKNGNDYLTVPVEDQTSGNENGLQNYKIIKNGGEIVNLKACPSSDPLCIDSGSQPQTNSNLTNESYTSSWSINASTAGTYSLFSESTSNRVGVNNSTSDSVELTVDTAVDSTSPTSSDNWTASGYVDASSTVVEITATDDDSGVANISYQVNGGGYTTDAGSSTTVTITSEGNNTLEYYATDNAGNQEGVNTEYVALAGDKNILSLDSPADNSEFTDSETVDIKYSGDFNNSGTYSLEVKGSSVDSTQVDSTTSFSSTYSDTYTPGNYTFQAVFNSDSGLTESTETRSFEVMNASTTKKILDTDSSTGNFYVSAGSSPVEYSNGFAPEDNTTVEWTVNATGGEGNSFEFFAFGNSTGSRVGQENSSLFTVTVNDSSTDSNNAPDASFSFSPTSPVDGESITFDGSGSSDSDGSVASYSWDFGDGSTNSGETASHTYGSSGDYTVELTVTDNDGATTSVTGTVSVGSSSDGGGGDSGGGSDGTSDNTTDESTSVGLGGSTAQILAPHLKARYGTDHFIVDSGSEYTVTIAGLEKTIGVTYVENSEEATITVDADTQNVSEGEFIEEGDPLREFVTAEDIIQTSSDGAGKVVFTFRGASDSNSVPIVHNMSIGENVSLDVQYRRTGGNDWITERTYSSSTGFDGLFTENISVSQGIFETRLVLSNSTDDVTSAPVGFLVGEVPDIEVTRPNQGEVFVRQPAPRVRLPLEYSSTTVNDTLYNHYYESSNGDRYTDTQVLSTESSDEFTFFDATEIVNQLPWVGVFGDEETPFFDFFGISDGSTFNQSLNVVVPGQEGDYTAYVNATDNNSLVNFSATSIGKTATLRITSSTNESVISDRENQTSEFTNQGVDSKASTDNDTQITRDFNNFTSGNETFKNPYFISYTPGDNATVTLQDLSNSSVDFAFDLSHEGDAILNKSIIIEENGSQVTELGLESGRSDYSFSVTPSMLPSTDTWNETSYEWYAVFKDGSKIVYNTKENMTDGSRTFQVEEDNIENKLTGNFWNDVAVVFNPANYSQIVQYFVSILLILVPGVLLREYEKVAVGSMIAVLVGTVLAGWMPTIIGLIIFIGFLLLIADRAGGVIG